MTENWQIALFGAAYALTSLLIGWGASGLAGLRKDIQAFVRRDDCAADMGEHCAKIGGLEKRMGKLENRVTSLETRSKIFHPEQR